MSTALTLYEIEDNLLALLNTEEMVEDPEQQEAIARDIVQAHMMAVDKRDRMGHFLAHCETQAVGIDAEIKRLQALKKAYTVTAERVESYIVRTIVDLGTDEKGRYRKLEGKTTVFGVRACPLSVEVTDETAVPDSWKSITVTLPALAWADFVQSADVDECAKFMAAVKKSEYSVDRRGVLVELKSNPVSGARIAPEKHSLTRK